MRKITPITALLITALIISVTAFSIAKTPEKLEREMHKAFNTIGYANITLPAPEKKFGQLTYSEITLDERGFSTVKTATLQYDPFAILFNRTLKNIKIQGLDLTGEINENGQISIAGWNNHTKMIPISSMPRAQNIEIENAKLSLLSEKWGGITLQTTMQLRTSKKHIDLQGQLNASQKQLSASAKIDGRINEKGAWNIRLELEQGKIQTQDIRATRLSGQINLNNDNISTQTSMIGEIQAGGLNILGLPWQSAAITLDGNLKAPRMIFAAKSSGYEGIELGITIENLYAPHNFSGNIHIDRMGTAFDYLESQKHLPIPRKNLKNLDEISSIYINIENKNNLTFNIKKDKEYIDIKGKIETKKTKENHIEFISTPLNLTKKEQEKYTGNLSLQGAVKHTPDKISGNVDIIFQNASLPYGLFDLNGINGKVSINDIQTLSGPPSKKLSCNIPPIGKNTSCEVKARIKNAKIFLSDLKISSPEFEITSPQVKRNKETSFLNIENADIGKIFDLFNNQKWTGEGRLKGTLTLSNKDGKLALNKLYLQNVDKGVLKLKDEDLFSLMQMEELETETMKLALENFHYDLLEIKASGEFPDNIQISVFGKGNNPLLLQGRPFSMDFEIKPDLTNIIKKFTAQKK